MPVLGVITKARADQGFRAEVQRLLPEAKNVVRVRALSERFDDCRCGTFADGSCGAIWKPRWR